MTDLILEQKIKQLQAKIISWAKKHKIWRDSGFKTYFEHFNDEPSEITACVTVMWTEGELYDILHCQGDINLLDDFDKLIDETEFWYEFYDSTTLQFYCKEDELNKQYLDYFEWQWISELIKPDYTNLYQEVFDYFHSRPKKLYSLPPRKLEILVSEIFRNQGYYSELGPGWNDGGVDLKLYKKDEIDQIVTLVQIKRYKESLPINLESVAYLQAIVDDQKANRGLFITTSRYLPQAKEFAKRQNTKLTLSDSVDVSKWCEIAKTKITRDKSEALSDKSILSLLKNKNGLEGKIVVASVGVSMILNEFCIIVKDTPHSALLMKISAQAVKHYDAPHNFRGEEIPLLNEDIVQFKNKKNVFRASKSLSDRGDIHFWGNKNLYSLWDGKPKYFDYID
jgi:hypothetical protein